MDLPDKSQGAPPPRKKLDAVITGAHQAQRPATKRFLHFLFAESPRDLLGNVARTVLVPRAKAGVQEALNSFIHGMFWGGGSSPLSQIATGTVLRGGGTQYHQITPAGTPPGFPSALQQAASQTRSSGNYQDVICPTQEAAEIVLANLYSVFNQYHVVTVADLYEIAGLTPATSDNNYGWTSLDAARIIVEREGYRVQLSRPTVI